MVRPKRIAKFKKAFDDKKTVWEIRNHNLRRVKHNESVFLVETAQGICGQKERWCLFGVCLGQ